jgi:YD repeat-containing protein
VNLLTTYAYDADGSKAHEALPNGVTTDYTYDTLNRLVDVNTADSTGKSLLSQMFILGKSKGSGVFDYRAALDYCIFHAQAPSCFDRRIALSCSQPRRGARTAVQKA